MAFKILGCLGGYAIVSALLYTLFPKKYRYIALLVSSLMAYAFMSVKALAFLLISIVTFYYAGILIDYISGKHKTKGLPKEERKAIKKKLKYKKKWVVAGSAFISVGLLMVLKYFNFFAHTTLELINKFLSDVGPAHLHLRFIIPLGISYYTLQGLSYVVDVSRGKYKAERNFLKVALFVGFFPQLNEGPFGRYDELMPGLTSGENLTQKNIYNGIARMFFGAFKIFIVANRAGMLADDIFKYHMKYSGITIVFGVIMFTLQLYAEFSGYINIATGIGEMFGAKLAKNFDMPFISKDVSEFWRRWHISLGAWFRDYIFYPVSTSKMSMKIMKKCKPAVGNFIVITYSLFIVWFLTGLWHGASSKYIVYGLYYFVLMILHNLLEPVFEKLWSALKVDKNHLLLRMARVIKTITLVLIGMLMFRAENLSVFKDMFVSIFAGSAHCYRLFSVLEEIDVIILILGFLIMLIPSIDSKKMIEIKAKYEIMSPKLKYVLCFVTALAIAIFGAYGIGYIPPDPIYGGF